MIASSGIVDFKGEFDQVSNGRFLFGIGCGWNAEEMEDHGTVYETRTLKMREQIKV